MEDLPATTVAALSAAFSGDAGRGGGDATSSSASAKAFNRAAKKCGLVIRKAAITKPVGSGRKKSMAADAAAAMATRLAEPAGKDPAAVGAEAAQTAAAENQEADL